jgi:hypothetical protein
MAERLFSDPALRDAYRALMRDNRDAHIDDATWDRIVVGELDDDRRGELFDHIAACDRCAGIWRGILALQDAAAAEGLVEREPAPGSVWRRVLPLAAAAVLVVAIGGLLMMRQSQPVQEPTRSAAGLAAVEGLMMAYAADGVPTLVWTPVPEATRYRVDVFTDDGRPVWQRDAASPPLKWPDDAPRVKGSYRWRVEASDGDTVLARSRLMPMELSR